MQGIRKQQLRMDLFHRISLQHVRNRMTQVILSLPYNTMPRMPSPTHVLIAYPAFYNILNVSNKGSDSIVWSSTKTSTLLSLPIIEILNFECESGIADSVVAAVERLPRNQHRPTCHIANITTAETYGIRPNHDMPPPYSGVLMSPRNIRSAPSIQIEVAACAGHADDKIVNGSITPRDPGILLVPGGHPHPSPSTSNCRQLKGKAPAVSNCSTDHPPKTV
jgi:hypothetical protein